MKFKILLSLLFINQTINSLPLLSIYSFIVNSSDLSDVAARASAEFVLSQIQFKKNETKQNAINLFKNKFKADPKAPTTGNIKETQEYKQWQADMAKNNEFAAKVSAETSEDGKIRLLGELFTNPQYSGGQALATLTQKKTTNPVAVKSTAQTVINAFTPLTK
jgi:hypothetical protein